MSDNKPIDAWALDYWLLQRYAKLCFNLYYRKVEVANLHNIPVNQPVILAPNHQNALMDAMVLVCNTPFQNVFLARADIFKGRRLIRFLTFLNIMPIYRIRDGIENVKKNDVVFERTVEVLLNRRSPLCLFAEGNHGDKRRLRSLVKGLFRIALQAQEKCGSDPAVKIIPIGFDYGHYQHFRSTLFVNIGQPIEVSDFMGTYLENPVQAINLLKDRFAAALSMQMIDIQTEEYYDLYMRLREIFNLEMRSALNIQDNSLNGKFRADKIMIDNLNKELGSNPSAIARLDKLVKQYWQALQDAGLRDWVIGHGKCTLPPLLLATLVKIVLLPVFAFGWVNNYLPYWFTGSRTKNIKDPQFHSSFKYVIGMIAFPIWYLVIAVVLFLTPVSWWQGVLYLVLMPVSGLAAFHYLIGLKKLKARWKFFCRKKTGEMLELAELRSTIISHTRTIMNRYK